MMLLDWIRKRLGYHVCEEFTQWETVVGHYSNKLISSQRGTVAEWKSTERWQERCCTICGKVQQQKLDQ